MTQEQRRSDSTVLSQVPREILEAPTIAAPATEIGDIVSTNTPRLEEAHGSFADFHQGYVTSYIQFADTKAAWVFAVMSGLLAYLFGKDDLRAMLFNPQWSVFFLLIVATVVLLILSAFFSFIVIAPRLSTSGEGVVFFSSVAKRISADVYVRDIASMSAAALTEARLKHSYDISRICARKYGHMRRAYWIGILALGLMAVVTLSL
jgi:hypothetical protein